MPGDPWPDLEDKIRSGAVGARVRVCVVRVLLCEHARHAVIGRLSLQGVHGQLLAMTGAGTTKFWAIVHCSLAHQILDLKPIGHILGHRPCMPWVIGHD